MAVDNISELLGDQPLIDENDLSDADGDDIPGGDGADSEPPSGSSQEPPAGNEPPDPYAGKKNVPLRALQEERTRRQQLQDELASRNQQNQQMEQRFQQMLQLMQQQQQVQLNQQQQAPQQQQPQLPSFVEDPEGYVNGLRAQFEAELAQLRGYQQQTLQQQQVSHQTQQAARHVASLEQEFSAKTPDYPAAADYFMQRKSLEYAALGVDPLTIQQQIQADYAGVAQYAIQNNKNPAELLYNMAKAMGYAKATQAQGKGQQQPKQPTKPAPTSLSDVQGAARDLDQEGSVTLENVAQMSDAEFDKFWAKMAHSSKQRPTF